MTCPSCKSTKVSGVEIQGVYDGVLFWVCACGKRFHRFEPQTWQHDAAQPWLDASEGPSGLIPDNAQLGNSNAGGAVGVSQQEADDK